MVQLSRLRHGICVYAEFVLSTRGDGFQPTNDQGRHRGAFCELEATSPADPTLSWTAYVTSVLLLYDWQLANILITYYSRSPEQFIEVIDSVISQWLETLSPFVTSNYSRLSRPELSSQSSEISQITSVSVICWTYEKSSPSSCPTSEHEIRSPISITPSSPISMMQWMENSCSDFFNYILQLFIIYESLAN